MKDLPTSTYSDKPIAKPPQVTIRNVERRDKEQVRRLVRDLHKRTIFGHMPFSDRKFDEQAERVFARPVHMTAIVAEYEERVIGFVWATVGQHAISEEGLIATCHVIAVETDNVPATSASNGAKTEGLNTRRASTFLRLVKAVKVWAKTRNANHVMVHITTGAGSVPKADRVTKRLLEKVGAKSVGGALVI